MSTADSVTTMYIYYAFILVTVTLFYHSDGAAVDAPKLRCGENEVINECPKFGSVENDCETLLSGFQRFCPPAPANYTCVPRCECKKEFVRINGTCQPFDKCCDENEEITDCPALDDDTCMGKAKLGCFLVPCFNKGCKCKDDYVRHDKVCIKKKDCPKNLKACEGFKPLEAVNKKGSGKKDDKKDKPKPQGKAKVVNAKNYVKRNDPIVNGTKTNIDNNNLNLTQKSTIMKNSTNEGRFIKLSLVPVSQHKEGELSPLIKK